MPESTSQPISSTSTGICPTDWHASSSSGIPAARVIAPTAAAGLTSPPWVGTWTSETSLTRSSSIASQRSRVELAMLVVGDHLDDRARALRHLAQRDVVARVLRLRGQYPVTRAKREGVEGHVPGAGGVLDERDLAALAADQPGQRVVGVLDAVLALRRRLVAADLGLAAQVVDDRVEDGRGTSPAPALLRWATSRQPGVSARARARSMPSDTLDERARPQASSAAHRHEADLAVGALELVQQRGDQPRAGGAERVAERHRAAVDVDAVHVG